MSTHKFKVGDVVMISKVTPHEDCKQGGIFLGVNSSELTLLEASK